MCRDWTGDSYKGSSGANQARRPVRDVAAEYIKYQVNCAGIFQAVPIEELPLADWRRLLDVNLTGMFLCCQSAMRVMRPQGSGRIVNFGSLAGRPCLHH